jgi:hypothetical protein
MSHDSESTSPQAAPAARPSKRFPAAMKYVRRVHMYLGLLLLPWVMFFGVSGMLFNHPNVGDDVQSRELSQEQLHALTGLEPREARTLAQGVISQLNAQGDGSGESYQLDPSFQGQYSGFTVLMAPGEGVNHILIVDLEDGTATLSTRSTASTAPRETAPFAGASVPLPEHSLTAVEAQLAQLLPKLDVHARTPLRANLRAAPELRFRMTDSRQRLWNVTYNLGSGRVDGRLAEDSPGLGFNELLTRMHKTHHYPLSVGATWFWALFADITAGTLVLWAVTGLFMWWQMKPTRVIGVAAVSVALGLGAAVMGSTIADIQFGNVQKRTGPGDGPPEGPPKALPQARNP